MPQQLITHIRKYVPLSGEEEKLLLVHTETVMVKKKTLLLREGKICDKLFFVQKGLLRGYFINEKGGEQTSQFAMENWWITDFMSFDQQSSSHFFIQSIENTELVSITHSELELLLKKVPQLERYFRLVVQRSYAASQLRIKYLFSQSGEERYHHFNSSFPEFVQRVPQYMLASYLGFTPEFLSKIRAGKL